MATQGGAAAALPDVFEVTGLPGVPLQQAIQDGTVPVPALMGYNDWQKWRKNVGRRPTFQADGVKRPPAAEVALRQYTMEAHYGAGWRQELVDVQATRAAAAGNDSDGDGGAGGAARGSAAAAAAASPQSRQSGKSESWDSQAPGSPSQLKRKLGKEFDPAEETGATYLLKARRMARALTIAQTEDDFDEDYFMSVTELMFHELRS